MNYKDFFERAVPASLEKYPSPDSSSLIRKVKERAKKMEKIKETKNRVSGVIGGIAGAAAVLAGAVFGLKYLNDNGGLKGPDVGGGAAYHVDIEPEQTTAESTAPETDAESADTSSQLTFAGSDLDEEHFRETDITYDLGDVTAHISGYNYDGLVLKVKYELTYRDEITNYPMPEPRPYDRRVFSDEILLRGKMNKDRGFGFKCLSVNNNTVEWEGRLMNPETGSSFDTVILDGMHLTEDEQKRMADSHLFDFTAECTVPEIPVIVRDLSEEMPVYMFADGSVVYPEKLYLSAYGVFIDLVQPGLDVWEKILPNMQPPRITLTMSDGSEITMKSENKQGTCSDGDGGQNYVGALFDEPIDTREVVSVNILGEPFVTFGESGGNETLTDDLGEETALLPQADDLRSRIESVRAEIDETQNSIDELNDIISLNDEHIKEAEESGDSLDAEMWTASRTSVEETKKMREAHLSDLNETLEYFERLLRDTEAEIELAGQGMKEYEAAE